MPTSGQVIEENALPLSELALSEREPSFSLFPCLHPLLKPSVSDHLQHSYMGGALEEADMLLQLADRESDECECEQPEVERGILEGMEVTEYESFEARHDRVEVSEFESFRVERGGVEMLEYELFKVGRDRANESERVSTNVERNRITVQAPVALKWKHPGSSPPSAQGTPSLAEPHPHLAIPLSTFATLDVNTSTDIPVFVSTLVLGAVSSETFPDISRSGS